MRKVTFSELKGTYLEVDREAIYSKWHSDRTIYAKFAFERGGA